MKRASTAPVSKGLVTKSALVAVAVVMTLAAPLSLGSQVFADQYDDQIAALRAQMNQYQGQASVLGKQADTYQAQLDQITAEKNAIIAQIDLSQQQYEQLKKQIADTEQKIADNKDALGEVIADMYVDESISPLEMLASSKNIGDYVDKQEYRESMQQTLGATIDEINALKEKLENSKKEVEKVLEEQKNQKAQLAAKEAEQQVLVNKVRGDEAAYNQLANNAQAQIESAAAQQRAYYASLRAQSGGSFDSGTVGSFTFTNWTGNMGCSGGYPYCAGSLDYGIDEWQLYYRECVSYAAWKIDRVYGKNVQPFGGYGMAYQWGQGYAKGAWRVDSPAPGDAVVLPATPGFAPVGHLMVVESVNGDWVHVSQYNFFGTGEYSEMDIRKSGVIFLRFPAG